MPRLIGRIVRAGQLTAISDEGIRFNGIVIEVNEAQLKEFTENLLFKEVEIRIGIENKLGSCSEEIVMPAVNKAASIEEQMTSREWNIPKAFTSAAFRDTWKNWIACRMKLKKSKEPVKMFGKQLEWLGTMSEAQAIEVMDASIRNGWIGLFEPRIGNGNKRAGAGNGAHGDSLVGSGSWDESRPGFIAAKRASSAELADPFGENSGETCGA